MKTGLVSRAAGAAAALFVTTSLIAGVADPQAPIATTLENASENYRLYNDHITTLANPAMEGRLPGSRGMEMAKEYCEYWLGVAGLEPAFPETETAADGTEVITPNASWRQPFHLSGKLELEGGSLAIDAGGEHIGFEMERDFTVTGLGGSNSLSLPMAFVGYSIPDGPDGYSSYADGDDLSGKVAVMLRFEPMDDEGESLWSGGAWTNNAAFNNKIPAAKVRGAAAVLIINTPGADDPRVGELMTVQGAGSGTGDVPVLMLTPEAGERLIAASDPEGRSLMDLRHLADQGGGVIDLNGVADVSAEIKVDPVIGENIGGVLPGRGALADEYIVIGAHLDHLGMGYFGSRSGPGKLHPGADDNASGSAGVLLFAKLMGEAYAQAPEGTPLRSVLFLLFSGEESGLNGSRAYVKNPIVPIDRHYIMINFDMIGRIKNGRLNVGGKTTAEGLGEFLEPYFKDTPLTVIAPDRMPAASDHTSFYAAKIPVLFGCIADFHKDYHTPGDVSWKINREGAVETIELFEKIAMGLAERSEPLPYVQIETGGHGGGGGPMGDIKVRFGVMPGYADTENYGVLIDQVSPGGSAEAAGVKSGDRLVRWDGQKVQDIEAWMEMLAKHKPGDQIKVGVLRDGKEVTLDVTLQAR